MSTFVALILTLLSLSAKGFCFDQAGAEYNVNPQLLRAIAQVESGMNHRVLNETHIQRTKTIDIGLMQINSGALPMLAKEGITQKDLIDNPCLNVRVGARILAAKFKREGANWDGVGAYNAGCSELKGEECQRARNAYTTKVWKALNKAAGQVTSQIDTNTEVVRLLKHGAGSTPATAQMSRIVSIDVASTDLPNTLE